MELKLHSEERIRVSTGYNKKNFIDIESEIFESAIGVSFLCSQTYFEVRKKSGSIKSFYFESKRHKKEFDFGWWIDAEVVYSNNEVSHIDNK